MYDCCELPEFFSERVSVARKEYKCCECRLRIPKGMLYWYCTGKWDGEMNWYRQHIECRDACYAFQMHNRDCIPFGGLWEYLSEHGPTWEEDWYTREVRLREKADLEKDMRSLFAQGKRASRLKTKEQIDQYNKIHERRKHAV